MVGANAVTLAVFLSIVIDMIDIRLASLEDI